MRGTLTAIGDEDLARVRSKSTLQPLLCHWHCPFENTHAQALGAMVVPAWSRCVNIRDWNPIVLCPPICCATTNVWRLSAVMPTLNVHAFSVDAVTWAVGAWSWVVQDFENCHEQILDMNFSVNLRSFCVLGRIEYLSCWLFGYSLT